MANDNLQETVLVETAYLFQPLQEINSPETVLKFLNTLGYNVPLAELNNNIKFSISKFNELTAGALLVIKAADKDRAKEALKLLPVLKDVFAELNNLVNSIRNGFTNTSQFFQQAPVNEMPKRLIDYLIYLYLFCRQPKVFGALYLMGILDEETLAANPYQRAGSIITIKWDRLPRYFSEPGNVINEVYNWNTNFDSDKFLQRFQLFLKALSVPGGIYLQSQTVKQALRNTTPNLNELRLPVVSSGVYPTAFSQFGINLSPAEQVDNNDKKGLALIPYFAGAALQEASIGEKWKAQIKASLSLDAGAGIILRPPAKLEAFQNIFTAPTKAGTLEVAFSVLQQATPGGSTAPIYIFGDADSTHLLLNDISATLFAKSDLRQQDLGIETEIKEITLAIKPGADADSFINTILSGNDIKASFGFGMGLSVLKGIYFRGSGNFEILIPVHSQLGLIDIQGIIIAVKPQDRKIPIEVSTILKAYLGPLQVVVEKIGLASTLSFPSERNGNLGPLNINLAFKPPTGAGLSLDSPAITGGGYLKFDPKNEEYAGILQLEIKGGIAIKAIGLLTTRLPDGSKGFSLLIIITGEFPPMPLGFGFTLNGIGGLLGVNRTMALEALRAGVKNRTLDSIMFPKDPVQNAQKIISDLQSVFPPLSGQHVFGPMVKIGWGKPATILVAEVGLVLELPSPLRLAIMAQFTLALPSLEVEDQLRVVVLHMDVLGTIDFDTSDATLDAVLFNSRIAAFPVTGEMAMRLNWGASPAFALSFGGFNPRFQPPPAFPVLPRMAIALAVGDNPRLRLEAYLALTSNTLQFGARLDAYAEFKIENIANVEASAYLGFDALVNFSPFSFIVDMEGQVCVRAVPAIKEIPPQTITGYLNLTLSGPQPWHAYGKVYVDFLGKHEVLINVKIGEETPPPALPPGDPLADLRAALQDTRNWSAQLPTDGHALVTLRRIPVSEKSPEILMHPSGELSFRQKVAPLDTEISKYGSTAPVNRGPFSITEVQFNQQPASIGQTVRDLFAPGQFFEMSDEEKLGRPVFESLPSGRAGIGTSKIEKSAAAVEAVFDYETVVIDDWEKRPEAADKYTIKDNVLLSLARLGAAGQSPMHTSGNARFAGSDANRVQVREPEYVVAGKDDMQGGPPQLSYVEAEAARRAKGATSTKYQVVGKHEIA